VRILVIDDEPDVQLLCRVNLAFEGHEVLQATDGSDGLAVARRENPDVIVLDVMLPSTDGFSVLDQLQEDEATSPIPVIMLTARTREEDQIRGWEHGAALYVTKPFSPAALCEAIARVGAMSPAEREVRRAESLRLISVLHNAETPPGG
jgi:DNA-binding response OmpR family regulator